MKKLLGILLFLSVKFYSQAPMQINYQGVARNAAGAPVTTLNTIGLQFVITDNSNVVVHNELQPAVNINNLGLFNTKIGLLSPISNTITWQNGPYKLDVSINLGAGLVPMGTQELVSVPYALYAKSSGSAASPSLAISGNSISIIGGNTVALPAGNTLINLAYVNNTGILSYTPAQFSNTLDISPSISFTNGVLTVGSQTTAINTGGLWSKPNATVTSLVFPGDHVGIGTNNPAYNLEVLSPNNSFIQARSNNGGIVGMIADRLNSSTGTYFVNRTNSIDDWAAGELGGSFDYVIRNWQASRNDILISNATGNVGFGASNPGYKVTALESNVGMAAIYGSNNSGISASTAHGIYGITNSSHTLAAAIMGENNSNAGSALVGRNNSISRPAIFGENTSGNTASPFAHGVAGITSNSGIGAISAGVFGESTGTGPGILGVKNNAIGPAGVFDMNNQSNAAEALIARTIGNSAAIKAVSSPTGTSSGLSLHLENGHIRSTAAMVPTVICTMSSFVPTVNVVFSGVRTDVKGKVLVNFPSSTIPVSGSMDVRVIFTKTYSGTQAVLITPTYLNLNYYLISVSSSDFVVRFVNSGPLLSNVTNFEFNYFVIE